MEAVVDAGVGVGEGGVLDIMHDRSRMTTDPCIPTMPGRSTWGVLLTMHDRSRGGRWEGRGRELPVLKTYQVPVVHP